jgi:hypothetical protein
MAAIVILPRFVTNLVFHGSKQKQNRTKEKRPDLLEDEAL